MKIAVKGGKSCLFWRRYLRLEKRYGYCESLEISYKRASYKSQFFVNPLSANPTKWSNRLKQFLGFCRQIIWVCLIILWGWRLKG